MIEFYEDLRRRALWDGISDRAQYFLSMVSINNILPIDVIAELNAKGYFDGIRHTQAGLDAVRYAVKIGEFYAKSGPDHFYPTSHIGVNGHFSRNSPITRVYRLRQGVRWRLYHAGIVQVGDLMALRKRYGTDWYRHLKGIGPRTAEHVEEVLFANQ